MFFILSTLKTSGGNFKEAVSNFNNSAKNFNELPKPVIKQAILPVKNKIHMLELDEKSKTESAEFLQKHKSITCHKLIENVEEPKLVELTSQNTKNGTHLDDTNGNGNYVSPKEIPPKPLPRKSISDQGSFDENNPIPKPKPRTACVNTSYKV